MLWGTVEESRYQNCSFLNSFLFAQKECTPLAYKKRKDNLFL
jgi:hypothetical protein